MTPVHAGIHVRENFSLLARAETRVLRWIAERLPRAINADHLSLLGLAAMAAAGLSFAAFAFTQWAALGVALSLFANWFGDSLDGTIARVRQQQRPRYGFYVDHLIDVAGTAMLVTGIACSGLMSPTIALALLAAYLLVSAESYLATHTAGVFRMSFLGVGPTELRILLAAGALDAAASPSGAATLFRIGGTVATIGLVAAFVVAGVRNTRALSADEPRPVAPTVARTA
jgi:phosphatidylglycerophosphate synthase